MYHPTKVISILIYVLNFNIILFAENSHNDSVRVNKCCEPKEILVNLRCADANESSEGIVQISINAILKLPVYVLKLNFSHQNMFLN